MSDLPRAQSVLPRWPRRGFLGGTAVAAPSIFLGKDKALAPPAATNLYRRLLDTWCRAMLALQIRNPRPSLDGGLLCPACARVHGRSADAVYPFLAQARASGESQFVEAAVRVMSWSSNVSEPSGAFLNDPPFHVWRGTTVFSAISLAEALQHHADLLDASIRERWRLRLRQAVDFLLGAPEVTDPVKNVNYTASGAAAFALASTIFSGDERYLKAARRLAHATVRQILPKSRLLYGEGGRDVVSPRGCRTVDIAYNVEESLPNLLSYARACGDGVVEAAVIDSLTQHLEFMIPDGGWDSSFSTRMFKWTYWGSRTSDGCQLAYGRLAARDPRFAEAAYRNAQLLERCTHDGLLHGGPHYREAGEWACIHHTFCHAKAMAAMVDAKVPVPDRPTALPRDLAYGARAFPEILTWLLAQGSWRATVTAYDEDSYAKEGHPSGGALSLLWHREVGPVFAASMTEYALKETTNQQRDRAPSSFSLTPRLEHRAGAAFYRNLHDLNTDVTTEKRRGVVVARARGRLRDKDHKDMPGEAVAFELRYELGQAAVISASVSGKVDGPIHMVLPVISTQNEPVRVAGGVVEITKHNRRLRIAADGPITLGPDRERRVFNHVPGMQALPILIELRGGRPLRVEIAVT